jgi:hypothetical protein
MLAETDRLAVSDRWEFMLYPLFGSDNGRRLVLLRDPAGTPAGVDALLVTPHGRRPRCDEPWKPRLSSEGWFALYERSTAPGCDDAGASDG